MQGYLHVGSDRSRHKRTASYANISQGKPHRRRCNPSKRHHRDRYSSCDIALVARRRLLKFLRTWVPYFFQNNISPVPRSQPSILPREPAGQAMAVSRGSCRGRALRRPHALHPVSHKPPHVHPYPRGSPVYEATLPGPISCRTSRSTWAVRVRCTRSTTLGHILPPCILPLTKFTVRVGTLSIYSI